VLWAGNRSGAVKVSVSHHMNRGLLEVLEVGGDRAELGFNASELRTLARELLRVAAALDAEAAVEEVTH
jgi:hypothetical protein